MSTKKMQPAAQREGKEGRGPSGVAGGSLGWGGCPNDSMHPLHNPSRQAQCPQPNTAQHGTVQHGTSQHSTAGSPAPNRKSQMVVQLNT